MRNHLLAAALAVASASFGGCSADAPAATPTCSAWFSGNVSDAVTVTGSCGGVARAADAGVDGGYVLSLRTSSSRVPRLTVDIDLGPRPTTGSFSSETTPTWSAVGSLGLDASDCGLSAGSGAVPMGSFRLTLASVDLARGTAHGTLDLTLRVHASVAADCGVSDLEGVEIAF